MAGAAPAAVSAYIARTYGGWFFGVYSCRRTTLCYYRGMSYEIDLEIACDCCGDSYLPWMLSSEQFANSLVCESCADALEFEAEFFARKDFDMGA